MVGGFSLSTQQDLDPYYSIYPVPQIRGAVRTPSTADVYVDGRLVVGAVAAALRSTICRSKPASATRA